jgi:hypothetical protein
MKRFFIIMIMFFSILPADLLHAAEMKSYTSSSEYFPFTFQYPADCAINSTGTSMPYILLGKGISRIEIRPAFYQNDTYTNVLRKKPTVTNLIVSSMISEFRKKNKTKDRGLYDYTRDLTINELKGSYTDVEFTAPDGTAAYYMLWVLWQPDYIYVINAVVPLSDSITFNEITKIAETFKLTGTPKPFSSSSAVK